jgi:membrane dipeptidase
MKQETIPVFDGHNDTLTRIYHDKESADQRSFFVKSDKGHIDLPRAIEGGFAGGFFAIFARSDGWPKPEDEVRTDTTYQLKMPSPLPFKEAKAFADTIIQQLFEWERESADQFKVVRTTDEIEACKKHGQVFSILHFEGVEMIDTNLEELYNYYNQGLRSLGIVWSRNNDFGYGVPFEFPNSPDIGPGLTDAGKRLVKACNELGVLVDLSHLNEKGFWDVAEISDAPLVATHSSAWELCNSTRNLTDNQMAAITESNGVAGVNFCKNFLRADGVPDVETPFTEILRHVNYMVEKMGIDHVAFGSDFDGATMPDDLQDTTKLPLLINAFRAEGYSETDIRKLAFDNWLRVLKLTWK